MPAVARALHRRRRRGRCRLARGCPRELLLLPAPPRLPPAWRHRASGPVRHAAATATTAAAAAAAATAAAAVAATGGRRCCCAQLHAHAPAVPAEEQVYDVLDAVRDAVGGAVVVIRQLCPRQLPPVFAYEHVQEQERAQVVVRRELLALEPVDLRLARRMLLDIPVLWSRQIPV